MADVADTELVRRCASGEVGAMRELVQRFQDDVFGISVRMLRNAHDAEDVSQEVFLRVFRSLHRWDRERPLRPWVLTIAVNRCRTALSKRSKLPELVDYLQESAAAVPDTDGNELTVEIRAAVEELRPDYREVFVLFHERGQSYEEISEVIDRPVGTIKTWLHRARAELLDRLKRRGFVPPEPTRAKAP